MDLFSTQLPPGLIYLDDWISAAEHGVALASIDGLPFNDVLSRRTQQYGYFYDYQSSEVNVRDSAPQPPEALAKLSHRLAAEGYFHRVPDQIIVNEYLAGQGIAEHIDRDSFGPVVATVSLVESWPMLFKSPEDEEIEVLLRSSSLALMTGASRTLWKHEIRKRKNDVVGGLKIPRTRRLSLTFRTVNDMD